LGGFVVENHFSLFFEHRCRDAHLWWEPYRVMKGGAALVVALACSPLLLLLFLGGGLLASVAAAGAAASACGSGAFTAPPDTTVPVASSVPTTTSPTIVDVAVVDTSVVDTAIVQSSGCPPCPVAPMSTAPVSTPQISTTQIPTTIDSTVVAETTKPAQLVISMAFILATIKARESYGGDYTAHAAKGSASGAYQFTDETWANFGGYARASDAPPSVQDAKAAEHVGLFLSAHGLAGVPVGWYYPKTFDDPSWMDRVPAPDRNVLTVRQYQTKWLETYTQIANGTLAGLSCSADPTTDGTEDGTDGGGEITDASGDRVYVHSPCGGGSILMATTMGAQTARLLAAACADGVVMGGWGARDAAGQIKVRIKNCGSSHYAIYDMPSSQCSPPTAKPGRSMHEQGKAIDFHGPNGESVRRGGAIFAWLSVHAARYGFCNLPSENWHWSSNCR
jgi:hypothetical protein